MAKEASRVVQKMSGIIKKIIPTDVPSCSSLNTPSGDTVRCNGESISSSVASTQAFSENSQNNLNTLSPKFIRRAHDPKKPKIPDAEFGCELFQIGWERLKQFYHNPDQILARFGRFNKKKRRSEFREALIQLGAVLFNYVDGLTQNICIYNANGLIYTPSIEQLADKAGLSKNTTQDLLKGLKDCGYIACFKPTRRCTDGFWQILPTVRRFTYQFYRDLIGKRAWRLMSQLKKWKEKKQPWRIQEHTMLKDNYLAERDKAIHATTPSNSKPPIVKEAEDKVRDYLKDLPRDEWSFKDCLKIYKKAKKENLELIEAPDPS